MSQATQIDFERLIVVCCQRHQNVLNLASPIFEEDGFITTAIMAGTGGRFEIRCGPAEYHAEIFIYTFEDQKRWNLADLMSIENIRSWMIQNRPDTGGRSQLEAEINYAFWLLTDGLKDVVNFKWLYCFS